MEHAKAHTHRFRPRLVLALAIGTLLAAMAPASVFAGGNAYPAAPVYPAADAQIAISAGAYGAVRSLEVELNKSMIVDLPAGVAEVVVSQPSIAAAVMRSRTRAIIQGIAEGATNIIFIDDAGRTMSILDVNIVQPPLEVGRALESTLARVIPGSNIRVETLSNNSINDKIYFVLTGTVNSAEDKAVAEAMAAQLSESDGPSGSLIQVTGPQQVMLQVTVSEIRRDVARQLGINLSGSVTLGNSTFGFNSSQTNVSNGIGGSFPLGDSVQINAGIRALENRGALRLLAQPTLTAMSGQPAEFLVGGEIPIQTSSINGTSIQYKQYGIQLAFTPTVRANGQVALTIDTGVSELQAGSSAALTTRDVKTSVELPPGTTLAIGGLLSESASRTVDQIPGLGNIPILGALFRSNAYRSQETELVILVTPYLVQPTTPANAIAVPTDNSYITNDAEAFFLGAIEKRYGVGATGEFRGGFSGSVGFALD
ncbi:type II and III secretion system protein family protein [Devosia rhizoryzae]|uniref:Type II and III secretion system protein family protein n=1 Tax=Devosia rhizoryzae TaxID=2774137 RepID=A0ABX7C2V7_9HYPH|nr:type II and III secretion system protein family protein [Devosia rhizoryzae]QQR38572.1 type II and III secretion system protein family protein [Devosia rhizoryzae]